MQMTCKYCGQEIPAGSVFCMYCGERVARKKREKETRRYPKYRTLSDGTLLGQLMVDGRRETVKAANEKEYKARIDAIRAGVLEVKAHPEKRTLHDVVRAYIDKNDGVLSPSTVRGYEYIIKGRFKNYMQTQVCRIDLQEMVNEESKLRAPKTVGNAWGLVAAAFRDAGIPVPEINLPQVPESDEDFLDHEEIKSFLSAIRGDDCELAAILMLQSLRMSELLKLDASDISDGKIHIRGAIVRGKDGRLVEKRTNKNRTSSRDVDIVIPRLTEILPEEGRLVTTPPTTLTSRIKSACKRAGVTVCSPHDLRRSFASLGYHLKWSERAIMAEGGWADISTVHRIYVKLSSRDLQENVQTMQNYYGFTTVTSEPAPNNDLADS